MKYQPILHWMHEAYQSQHKWWIWWQMGNIPPLLEIECWPNTTSFCLEKNRTYHHFEKGNKFNKAWVWISQSENGKWASALESLELRAEIGDHFWWKVQLSIEPRYWCIYPSQCLGQYNYVNWVDGKDFYSLQVSLEIRTFLNLAEILEKIRTF